MLALFLMRWYFIYFRCRDPTTSGDYHYKSHYSLAQIVVEEFIIIEIVVVEVVMLHFDVPKKGFIFSSPSRFLSFFFLTIMSQASGSIASRISQKLASKEFRDYITSTHFWGPVANWGIPLAAIGDTQKDASMISGNMTAALCVYSALFMRFALAVQPTNYLLFACHFVNEGAQLTQGYRYLQYNKFGGKEKAEAQKLEESKAVTATLN